MGILQRFSDIVSANVNALLDKAEDPGKMIDEYLRKATKDLAEVCRRADIRVAAVGKAGFVTADMVKPGAVVIDVGMNRNAEGKLCGDVDFAAVEPVASYITPVPGGVGPMTITMLMKNTLKAAKLHHGIVD